MSLALSSMQPFSEVCTWDDRTIDTAWDLIRQADKKSRHEDPGAGGPQYSG